MILHQTQLWYFRNITAKSERMRNWEEKALILTVNLMSVQWSAKSHAIYYRNCGLCFSQQLEIYLCMDFIFSLTNTKSDIASFSQTTQPQIALYTAFKTGDLCMFLDLQTGINISQTLKFLIDRLKNRKSLPMRHNARKYTFTFLLFFKQLSFTVTQIRSSVKCCSGQCQLAQ